MAGTRMIRVGVLGGGAWGTALALVAARAGHPVTLWARDPATVASINTFHENRRRLAGTSLPPAIAATSDLHEAAGCEVLLCVVPAQAVREVTMAIAGTLPVATPLVICAKGLESGTGLRLSEVTHDTIPSTRIAVLSGPGFAADVAAGLPTAVTIAARDEQLASDLCRLMAGEAFRPYGETDVIGVEIGGAVKNVLAIAAGIVAGRKLGASAQAAMVARGFAELRRLGEALGARGQTLMGLSGLGDLVLTCGGAQSRNFAYGEHLGRADAEPEGGRLVEGAKTAAATRLLARANNVEMPIVEAVAEIVEGRVSVDAAINQLLARPLRSERD
jgi:glycerol-3-phosphate dehydrogenase (NAD(P)+)